MQPVHYFQRYSQPENVATNNTLLLLSRLYYHSPAKFNLLMNELFIDFNIQPGVIFKQQEKSDESIPDGSITQESFQVVIETKLYNNFSTQQLLNHCKSFTNSKIKILLSLSPGNIATKNIDSAINKFNKDNKTKINYTHLTFKQIIESIRRVINEYDSEFLAIIDDYEDYCFQSSLIDESEDWMRAVTCGMTLDENFKYNLYYDPADRGYSRHGYIGIYANKCIRGVGKIVNIVTADLIDGKLHIYESTNPVDNDVKDRIILSINDAYEKREWVIDSGHKFFIVDKFHETSFQKRSNMPLRGTKFFNLAELLEKDKLPATDIIALELNNFSW